MNIHTIESKKIVTGSSSQGKVFRPITIKQDAVVLSLEAQAQFKAQQTNNIDSIQHRIESGWYYRREITESIARVMLASNVI